MVNLPALVDNYWNKCLGVGGREDWYKGWTSDMSGHTMSLYARALIRKLWGVIMGIGLIVRSLTGWAMNCTKTICFPLQIYLWSWGSPVSAMTPLGWMERNYNLITGSSGRFFIFWTLILTLGAHPASCAVVLGPVFAGVKELGHEGYHSWPWSGNVENACSYLYLLFTVCCHGMVLS